VFKTRDGKGNEGKRKRERETGAKERASDRKCYRIARVLHPSGNKTANACVKERACSVYLFKLSRPEIRKYINQKRSFLAAAASAGEVDAATRATHSIFSRWLENRHDHLLHKEWMPKEIKEWRAAVDDILQHWCVEAGPDAFPQLHMLRHSLDFAERHRFLGRTSEA